MVRVSSPSFSFQESLCVKKQMLNITYLTSMSGSSQICVHDCESILWRNLDSLVLFIRLSTVTSGAGFTQPSGTFLRFLTLISPTVS